jgi:LytS/YehU family sensor histidine kinase
LWDVGKQAGTGLANLRERLRLAFGDTAHLRLIPIEPHGVCAEFELPAREAAP